MIINRRSILPTFSAVMICTVLILPHLSLAYNVLRLYCSTSFPFKRYLDFICVTDVIVYNRSAFVFQVTLKNQLMKNETLIDPTIVETEFYLRRSPVNCGDSFLTILLSVHVLDPIKQLLWPFYSTIQVIK